MEQLDPRVADSLPTATTTEAYRDEAADVLIAAAAKGQMSPAVVGDMLVSAGRSIVDEDDLLALLQRVAEIASEVIEGADSTGITIDLAGRTFTAVHTDDRTLRVDSEQYDAGDGPCLHAARTRTTVVVDFDDARARWPRFAQAAADEGVHSFLAAPLFTPELTLGSFNLYGRTRSAFDAIDADIMDLLTATVSRTIGDFARFSSARNVAESLQTALSTRAPIEQAKGMLMAIHGVSADEAFNMLRKKSQDSNVRLHTIAVEFVAQVSNGTNGA